MRRGIFAIGFVLLFLATGCTLEDGLDLGEKCYGFLHVLTPSGPCGMESAGECVGVPDLAVAFERGRCPKDYLCDMEGRLCYPKCDKAQDVFCDDGCVNPMTSPTFCGASGSCRGDNKGVACLIGWHCAGGECVPSCQEGQVFCEGRCINPNDDLLFCGASGDCEGENAGQQCEGGQKCNGGKCQCPGAQVLCNGACISPETDQRFCGASDNCEGDNAGQRCESWEACRGGKCELYCAESSACFFNGECVENEANYCGRNCTNCNAANYAAEGECHHGVCTITACIGGYYLAEDKNCLPYDERNCGGERVDCLQKTGWENAICDTGGKCIATACKIGHHLAKEGGDCIKDTAEACGLWSNDCTKLEGWDGVECRSGQCRAMSCKEGFCLNTNEPYGEGGLGVCVVGNNSPLTCGIGGGQCKNCRDTDEPACNDGECVENPCAKNVCYHGGGLEGCRNTDNRCGENCLDCDSMEGVKTGVCTAGGDCNAVACLTGYHLDRDGKGRCESDSNTVCGAGYKNCNSDGNAADGTCINGECTITKCAAKYCLNGSACVIGTNSNATCGISGGACLDCGARTCVDGACTCLGSLVFCGSSCIDPNTNTTYCGARGTCRNIGIGNSAGTTCDKGQQCSGGECVCMSSGASCGGIDGNDTCTSTSHCGSCGIGCLKGQQCSSGECVCMSSGARCGGIDGNDTCTSTSHCGSCGIECLKEQVCIKGHCEFRPTCSEKYPIYCASVNNCCNSKCTECAPSVCPEEKLPYSCFPKASCCTKPDCEGDCKPVV